MLFSLTFLELLQIKKNMEQIPAEVHIIPNTPFSDKQTQNCRILFSQWVRHISACTSIRGNVMGNHLL